MRKSGGKGGAGVKKMVLIWGPGPRGEGATLHPKIYNIFFFMTLAYKVILVTG
tara:strand:- start:44 stop:202 length:159 start_codon:yes stop_codon:yes gene_type:complete